MSQTETVLGLSGAPVTKFSHGNNIVYIKKEESSALQKEYALLRGLKERGFAVPNARIQHQFLVTEAVPGPHLDEFLTKEVMKRQQRGERPQEIFIELQEKYLTPALTLFEKAGAFVPEILNVTTGDHTTPDILDYVTKAYEAYVSPANINALRSMLHPLEDYYQEALQREGAWTLDAYARNIRVDEALAKSVTFDKAIGFYDPVPRFEPRSMTRERLIGSLVAVRKWWNGEETAETAQPGQFAINNAPLNYFGEPYLSGDNTQLTMRFARAMRLAVKHGEESLALARREKVPATLGTTTDALYLFTRMSCDLATELQARGVLPEGAPEAVRETTNRLWGAIYEDGTIGRAYSRIHDCAVPKPDGFVSNSPTG